MLSSLKNGYKCSTENPILQTFEQEVFHHFSTPTAVAPCKRLTLSEYQKFKEFRMFYNMFCNFFTPPKRGCQIAKSLLLLD